MEQSAAAVRVTEAIPSPLRFAGWLLLLGPVLAFIPNGAGRGGQLRSLVDEGLGVLGLGTGIAPLEFFAFAWVAVAMLFWLQARSRGHGLGPRSSVVLTIALAGQVLIFLVTNTA